MKYIQMPGFQEAEGPIPCVCSLSPILRLAANTMGYAFDNLKKCVLSVIEEVANNKEVADSLKKRSPIPGSNQTRQVDIRADDNGKPADVVLKCFISWDSKENWWVIHVEGANENHWEKELFHPQAYEG